MCTLKNDVRSITQCSWPEIDGSDLVLVDVEFYLVDEAGRRGAYEGHREFDVEQSEHIEDWAAPDYYCLSCDQGLADWATVVDHVDDFDDDSDGGVGFFGRRQRWNPAF